MHLAVDLCQLQCASASCSAPLPASVRLCQLQCASASCSAPLPTAVCLCQPQCASASRSAPLSAVTQHRRWLLDQHLNSEPVLFLASQLRRGLISLPNPGSEHLCALHLGASRLSSSQIFSTLKFPAVFYKAYTEFLFNSGN